MARTKGSKDSKPWPRRQAHNNSIGHALKCKNEKKKSDKKELQS
jgi:hypothetical protein